MPEELMTATIEPRAAAILTGLLRLKKGEVVEDGHARWEMSHGITIEMWSDPPQWHVGVSEDAADAGSKAEANAEAS